MKNRWAFWLILFCCILVLLIIAAQFAWSWDPRANSIPAVSEPAPSADPSSSSEAAASGASSRSGSASGVPEEAEGQEETDEERASRLLRRYGITEADEEAFLEANDAAAYKETAERLIDEIPEAARRGEQVNLTEEELYCLLRYGHWYTDIDVERYLEQPLPDEILEEYDERQRMRELAQQAIDEINRAVAEGREPDLTKEEGYALMMDNSKEALEAIDKIAKPVPWPSDTPEDPEQFQEGEGETSSHYAVGYDPDTGEEFIVG